MDALAKRRTPINARETAELLDVSKSTATIYLNSFEARDWTVRSGQGIRGNPYRFSRGPQLIERIVSA